MTAPTEAEIREAILSELGDRTINSDDFAGLIDAFAPIMDSDMALVRAGGLTTSTPADDHPGTLWADLTSDEGDEGSTLRWKPSESASSATRRERSSTAAPRSPSRSASTSGRPPWALPAQRHASGGRRCLRQAMTPPSPGATRSAPVEADVRSATAELERYQRAIETVRPFMEDGPDPGRGARQERHDD